VRTPPRDAAQLDTGYHRRRLAGRLEDPKFRAEFERAGREIAATDGLIRRVDELRQQANVTKAGLARAIGKDPASIRRLFTSEANPTIRTFVAMLDVLGAELTITPKPTRPSRSARDRSAAA
jgi:DNA-binding phage protein